MKKLTFAHGLEDGHHDAIRGLSEDFLKPHLIKNKPYAAGYRRARRDYKETA